MGQWLITSPTISTLDLDSTEIKSLSIAAKETTCGFPWLISAAERAGGFAQTWPADEKTVGEDCSFDWGVGPNTMEDPPGMPRLAAEIHETVHTFLDPDEVLGNG